MASQSISGEEDYEFMEGDTSELVDNYTALEFVAIPPDFEIENYLTLRESAGIFKYKEVDLEQVKKIAMGVKYSPVFSILNNALLSPSACMYFLSVVNELGLVVKAIHNPMRMSGDDYKRYIDTIENDRTTSIGIRSQIVMKNNLNFVIVNIFPLMSEGVINEAMEIAQKLQTYQTDVAESFADIGKID